MDFPVEATIHLNSFPNEYEVQKVLRSHGLELIELWDNQVRVRGSFLRLKTAKASLEQLLHPQTRTETRPSSSLPVTSRAISKSYKTNGESSTPNALYEVTSKTRPVSPEYRDAFSSKPNQHGSFRPEKESFPVDADVFEYADKLRNKDINLILHNHNVMMQVSDVTDENRCVTLMGRGAKTAVSKLQSLLDDLRKSLRTQEVRFTDMDHGGRALWEKIQNKRNIYNTVLVCQRGDCLHLIGSYRESYELKQKLLGNSVEHSGRTGRTVDRNSQQRSSSLPPINRRGTGRDKAANGNLSPAGAAGYTPTKYQDGKQNQSEPERAAATGFGFGKMLKRRSTSESRRKTQPEATHNGYVKETEKKTQPGKAPMMGIKHLINVSTVNIKQTFKRTTRKRDEK